MYLSRFLGSNQDAHKRTELQNTNEFTKDSEEFLGLGREFGREFRREFEILHLQLFSQMLLQKRFLGYFFSLC
jgi:hypothetical protein